jgi:hypothetical protein
MRDNTTSKLVLLENVNIIVTHSSKVGCTTYRSRTSTNDSDGFFIRRRQVFRKSWISNLRDAHFFENSNGKFLKSINFYSTLLSVAHVAVTSTQLTNRAKLTASQTKRIVRKNNFSGAVPVFVLNVVDESLNVDCC